MVEQKTFGDSSLQRSSVFSEAVKSDQSEAQKSVPTAINHKNITAQSTTGRSGAYNKSSTAINDLQLTTNIRDKNKINN